MMTQKLGNGFEFIKKAYFVCGSFNHLIKDCDFHDNKMVEKPVLNNKGRVTGQRKIRPVWNNAQRVNHQNKLNHPHPKRKFVPTVVLTKSGHVPVNAVKQSSLRAATSISTARPVNIAAPKSKGNPQYTLRFRDFWKWLAVSTACYVKNRVLVAKRHNKTPYELLHSRPPSISFMRPFGYSVTILNTLDPLGKFDKKADEGFFVGYSINSKAFRVFNTRTRKVEDNLHINVLENKPNVAGSGPDWLFDIDLLTNSMNYEPVTVENQTNKNAGIKDNVDMLMMLVKRLMKNQQMRVKEMFKKKKEELRIKKMSRMCKILELNWIIYFIYMMFTLVNAVGSSCDNLGGSIPVNAATLPNADLPTDPLMPDLENTANLLNTGIFSDAYDYEDVGVETDLNNLETTMNVSRIPTTRIHKDHPKN
ncbi:retrovirus-related pol polyprotein from transposon TNT 1-94 [Tanacetum coccineum]